MELRTVFDAASYVGGLIAFGVTAVGLYRLWKATNKEEEEVDEE